MNMSFLAKLRDFFFSAYLRKQLEISDDDRMLVSSNTNSMDFLSARQMAMTMLGNSDIFTCSLSNRSRVLPGQLPPGVRELFQDYSRIDWRALGLCFLDVDYMTVSADNADLVFIGEMMERPILVRSVNERVFVIVNERLSEQYLSVYHWLIEVAQIE